MFTKLWSECTWLSILLLTRSIWYKVRQFDVPSVCAVWLEIYWISGLFIPSIRSDIQLTDRQYPAEFLARYPVFDKIIRQVSSIQTCTKGRYPFLIKHIIKVAVSIKICLQRDSSRYQCIWLQNCYVCNQTLWKQQWNTAFFTNTVNVHIYWFLINPHWDLERFSFSYEQY